MSDEIQHWKGKLPAIALAALAGCATAPVADAFAASPYRALGTEPFWSVTIAGGRIAYDSANGPRFSVAAPAPRATSNGRRYETARLTLDIAAGECSDGMSDRRYADTVAAVVDGETLRGCGGAILPPETLAGTAWSITGIDGEPVRGEAYVLQFDDGRLSGQAGCNRFSGPYAASGGTLSPGPIAATRMACAGPRMDHERRALRLLGGPVAIRFPDGDVMVLTGSGGEIRLRRSH